MAWIKIMAPAGSMHTVVDFDANATFWHVTTAQDWRLVNRSAMPSESPFPFPAAPDRAWNRAWNSTRVFGAERLTRKIDRRPSYG